jgi:hypothetical protein
LVWKFWMIWSSFFIDSADGPPAAGGAGSKRGEGVGSRFEAAEPARTRPARLSSLGLFVRVGFVCGEEAGDETRGEGRAC